MTPARPLAVGIAGLLALVACTTSPLGRKQLMLVSDSEMDAMGVQAFSELKKTTPIDHDPTVNAYVRCVALPITEAARGKTPVSQWEIVVFNDPQANAFALPGGKIGVYSGLLKVAKSPAQLATVLGHEVGHVIARHGAERVSESIAQQGGMALVDAFVLGKSMSQQQRGLILGALGVGAQLGFALPHSRTQESEADLIGLDLMSEAGFDPRQSVELWKNMSAAAGGKAPPEFLSTHPANESRIQELERRIPREMPVYEKARASGPAPSCRSP